MASDQLASIGADLRGALNRCRDLENRATSGADRLRFGIIIEHINVALKHTIYMAEQRVLITDGRGDGQ